MSSGVNAYERREPKTMNMKVLPSQLIGARILETASSSLANSCESDKKDACQTKTITFAEAKKLNLAKEDIIPRQCSFCSSKLQAIGVFVDVPGFRKWIRGEHDYECCDCQGAQQQRKAERQAEERRVAAEKERAYREKIERMIWESKLGKRFRTRTFKNFQPNKKSREALETAWQYARDFAKYKENGTGLLLTGSYGTGKTHLAAAICHELIRSDYQPIFGTMISLLGNIKATYGDEYVKETEQQILNKYISCDLLVIDDLGKERPTEWALEKLYYVINSRYEACRPLVITTNYADKLANRLTCKDNTETAEAIVSRIYEMCVGVMMTWEDYRKL